MTDQELNDRLARIENAVSTMAWWLVSAQTGFGKADAEGIDRLLAAPAGERIDHIDEWETQQ